MIRDGQDKDAETVLRQTILDFPNWPLPKDMLAILEASTNSTNKR